MDANRALLQKKLQECLSQAAAIATQIQALEQGPGTPHYDDIEMGADVVGKQLSREIQEQRSREVAGDQPAEAACPECGRKATVQTTRRKARSIHGGVEILETKARCRRCRRDFFPSESGVGPGR